jgi:dienelactone hydrolase
MAARLAGGLNVVGLRARCRVARAALWVRLAGMNRFISCLAVAVCATAVAVGASAKIVTQSVAYEHAGVKLEGFLAYDDSVTAPRPGVLVVHEWWGLNDYVKDRAQQLAALGYVAFALDMYGAGVVTSDAKKAGELAGQFYGNAAAWAARARAGLDQLLATGKVAPGQVASIGFCFGGSTSLVLAYSGAPLAGVVSFHGTPIPAAAGAANGAKVLMLHGAADVFIKPEEIAAFEQSLNAGKFDWQWISYAGAVHAFSNPGADALGKANNIPIFYQETAARRSWEHMKLFFAELFAR